MCYNNNGLKKIELKVCYGDKKSAVLKTAAGVAGVVEVKIDGDKLIVIGEVDPAKLAGEIKKIGTGESCCGFVKKGKELSVEILSVGKPPEKKEESKCSSCCCSDKPCDDKNCLKVCCKKLIVCPNSKPGVVNPCIDTCNGYRGYNQSSPIICYEPCYDNYGGSDCVIM